MLDQFHLCTQDSIENIIDVKADGNYGYQAIAVLLGMGEKSWSLVRNHLHKELTSWSEEYINLVGGIQRFEELKLSLYVDGLTMVRKFIIMSLFVKITFQVTTICCLLHVGYHGQVDEYYKYGICIASRYNVIVVSLSRQ